MAGSGAIVGTAGDLAGELWVGIDLGTQSVRVIAVTGDGDVAGLGAHPLTSDRGQGRHEQDPEAWWAAVTKAARAALPAGARVRAVAVCSTSGTVLLAGPGRGGQEVVAPLSPALMYDDARADAEAEVLRQVDVPAWRRTGQRPQPTWGLAKAAWLLDRHDGPRQGLRVLHQADLVNARLVGAPTATDTSHALKTGADLLARDWPEAALAALGLDRGVLPGLVRSGTVLGTVGRHAAEATGITEGAAVVAGFTDGCAAQVASGAVDHGRWNVALGTTMVLKGVTDEPLADPSGATYSHLAPDGRWWPGGASSTGAGVLSEEFPDADLAELDRHAAAHEPASVATYPLAGVGERFPFTRPDARGFTLGTPRGDADRYAAILQGVAFVERLCLDHLTTLGAPVTGPVALTGGAARSRYWPQLQADVLGREVVVPAVTETALGVAVLAAAGATGEPLPEVAARMTRTERRYSPRPGAAERFAAPYARLVDALAERGWIPERLRAAALAAARA